MDGVSERGGHPVVRMNLKQWMLAISLYGDRLLDELADLSWPESIKLMQRNWIGRSIGAEVDFQLAATRRRSDHMADGSRCIRFSRTTRAQCHPHLHALAPTLSTASPTWCCRLNIPLLTS
ncbi:MAG UNVERIFIED_CONTAM: hypothetical protein LVR18_48545 [Planctomycetaceae bacterium]